MSPVNPANREVLIIRETEKKIAEHLWIESSLRFNIGRTRKETSVALRTKRFEGQVLVKNWRKALFCYNIEARTDELDVHWV